jgi:hypothetical protein
MRFKLRQPTAGSFLSIQIWAGFQYPIAHSPDPTVAQVVFRRRPSICLPALEHDTRYHFFVFPLDLDSSLW